MNILLCTLGQTWAVIPEALALLDPDRCPLYKRHPRKAFIENLRREYRLEAVDELWICTTDDPGLDSGLEKLRAWKRTIAPAMPLRIWRTAEVSDLADRESTAQVQELIYRAVLLASRHKGENGHLYLSLAGGRKTMSADLQQAGMLMGCDALLHVIAPPYRQMTPKMQEAAPASFQSPLEPADLEGVLPLVVGRGLRSELLDIHEHGFPDVDGTHFPLPLASEDGEPLAWTRKPGSTSLPGELERREREGSRLLGNFLQAVARDERHESWRSLYRLPPARIAQLRGIRLSDTPGEWITRLPKADLHRHIGGCLDLAAQRKVGRAIWQSLSDKERRQAYRQVGPLLEQTAKPWAWNWPELLKQGVRSHNAAALLVEASDEQLERNLYQETEPRKGLNDGPRGFAAYERPGELSGSATLSHPAALEPYLRALLDDARKEGVRYLELRGSPQKYRRTRQQQIEFLRRMQAIAREYGGGRQEIELRFIIIADRRKIHKLGETVQLAVQARQVLGDFVVGLDLAGDEARDSDQRLKEIATHFEPAFAECIPITIHAGEGTPAEQIWNAAYRLHADRVGHGLTLLDQPRLLERFRDRGICVELCPTSNDEVVGYDAASYPLVSYWKKGVPLTLCTDNPGISRTTLNEEFRKATEYWPDMSAWDALAILKQGFIHAFLPAEDKERMLKRMDSLVYDLLEDRNAFAITHRQR